MIKDEHTHLVSLAFNQILCLEHCKNELPNKTEEKVNNISVHK